MLGATEIGEGCGSKVLFGVSVRRSLAAFETAISADRWQSESSGSFREHKGGKGVGRDNFSRT